MKKIALFLVALLCSSVNAKLSDDEILSFFSIPMPGSPKISIESRENIKDTNFEQIILLIELGEDKHKEIFFSDGKYLFPDLIDVKNKGSYKSKFVAEQNLKKKKANYEKLAKVMKNYPKNKIIELGDKNKELVYIFTDPLCPFCQRELDQIETRLKEVRLKVIFTPITSHGEDAIARSLAIQQETKNAKTDEEKIKIFRKYYDAKNSAPKYSKDDIKAEQDLISDIFKTQAISGVPSFIQEQDLKF